MSKSSSRQFCGTKGYIVTIARSLPTSPNRLLDNGWEDISNPNGVDH